MEQSLKNRVSEFWPGIHVEDVKEAHHTLTVVFQDGSALELKVSVPNAPEAEEFENCDLLSTTDAKKARDQILDKSFGWKLLQSKNKGIVEIGFVEDEDEDDNAGDATNPSAEG